MAKRISEFKTVVINWLMPAEERHQMEAVLESMGYSVDGGGTNLASRTAEIYVRPKKRVRNSKKTEGQTAE
jgi:hypothetical protein